MKGPGPQEFTFTTVCLRLSSNACAFSRDLRESFNFMDPGEIPFSSDRKRMSVIVKHVGG